MKVAAFQASLQTTTSPKVLDVIREQVGRCETEGVEILCCPEGVLGGLADYVSSPFDIAISAEGGQLQELLAPIASDRVTTILGFTEIARNGRLYNSAAVFHRGRVAGVYRKLHPAINKSVYAAGDSIPVFTVGSLTFGILICRDSIFQKPAQIMAAKGARMLFVPTNCGMPSERGGAELVWEARRRDRAMAKENGVFVVRADVAGRTGTLVSYGASGVIDREGNVLREARQLGEDFIVAEIEAGQRPIRV